MALHRAGELVLADSVVNAFVLVATNRRLRIAGTGELPAVGILIWHRKAGVERVFLRGYHRGSCSTEFRKRAVKGIIAFVELMGGCSGSDHTPMSLRIRSALSKPRPMRMPNMKMS